jgi:hypothetical protein
MPSDPTRQTLSEFIANVMKHGADNYTDDDLGHEAIDHEAAEFTEWVDKRELQLESPPEWLAAWQEYVNEYEDDDEPDGQPDEAQEWHDYDPEC